MSHQTWRGWPSSPPTYTEYRPEAVAPFSQIWAQSRGRVNNCPTRHGRGNHMGGETIIIIIIIIVIIIIIIVISGHGKKMQGP